MRYNIDIMKIPNFLVQEADTFSKDTRTPFRDSLEILIYAYLADEDRLACTQETETVAVNGVEWLQANNAVV